MERIHDDPDKEYEGWVERARDVPQDGEKPPPPKPTNPNDEPAKRQPPAHRDFPPTKIWDEASQRYMEGLDHDRKQATEADYHDHSLPDPGDAGED